MRNWAGNVTFRAARVVRPESLDELREVVAGAPRVRALGSGHSFNELADSPGGVLVALDHMPAGVEIDAESATVTVAAGMRYAELASRLHVAGFALPNMASLPHISVAGSCATATHGSGERNGNLATAVTALELVTAEGDLVTLHSDRDGDRFRGAVVGLGALGVVTSLTLGLVPAFEMRQYVYERLPFDAIDHHFDDIQRAGYSVSLFTDWRGASFRLLWVKRRAEDPPPPGEWFGARAADGPRHPVPGIRPDTCTEQLGVPGPWFERLPHFRPGFTPSAGEELQSEYLLPRRYAVAALRALHGIRERLAPVTQICEVRTVAGDDLWLSTAYGEDAVALHFTWLKDPAAVLALLPLVEERLAAYAARPHWGKLFTLAPEVLRSRYPRLPEFAALARHFDPSGKFGNDLTALVLGGT